MGEQAKFCLKWNNFGKNVTSTFKSLLENEEFVDISLSAQGGTIKAHRVVLSASSQYFREVIQGISPWQHPVILLRDVPFSDLQGIVEFIYHGEVSVEQENLNSFLKTAQFLRVKGLTDDAALSSAKDEISKKSLARDATDQEEEIDDVEEEEEEIPWHKIQAVQQTTHHHPRKSSHPKRAINQLAKRESDNESEPGVFPGEIDDREEEEINAVTAAAAAQHQAMSAAALAAANNMLQHFMSSAPPPPPPGLINNGTLSASVKDDDPDVPMIIDEESRLAMSESASSPFAFNQGGGKSSNGNMSQKKTCPYCQQQLSWHALSRHIRDMHKNKSCGVTCKVCGKAFRNKNSLGCHMWRFHKDATNKSDLVKMEGGGNGSSVQASPEPASSTLAASADVQQSFENQTTTTS